jgi:hypothetical protein
VSLVTCLCVTHERHKWIPWVYAQVMKQTCGTDGRVFDSSAVPHQLSNRPCDPIAIAPKRNIALASVTSPYFAWFDDDDWSHPERLERCVELLEACPQLVAAGPVDAYKIDARTLAAQPYTTNEHLIFNGAVFRTSHWQRFSFAERLAVGEDTDWMMRGLRGQAYGVVNKILSAWLCHTRNIANRADRILFERTYPAQLTAFKAELESNPEYQR